MEEKRIEEPEEEFEDDEVLSENSSSLTMVFVGIAVGLLACIIGAATRTSEAMYAGVFIIPLSLFGGGLLLKEQNSTISLGMLIAGGLVIIFVAGYAFSWASSLIGT
jgi:hypothetical protein